LPKEISRVEINKIGKIEIKGVPVFSLQPYQIYSFSQCYQIYIFCEDNFEIKRDIDVRLKELTNNNLIIVIILD